MAVLVFILKGGKEGPYEGIVGESFDAHEPYRI